MDIIDELEYKRKYIRSKSNVLYELLKKFPDNPWNWNILAENPNITWEIAQMFPKMSKSGLSENPSITWEIVESNPSVEWHKWSLLRTIIDNASIQMLLDTPEKNWEYNKIIDHPLCTWEKIYTLHFLRVHINSIVYNPHITSEILEQHPNLNWNIANLTSNKSIGIDYILTTLHTKPWCIVRLSERLDVNWKIVKKHLDLKWDFDRLSSNPSIKWGKCSRQSSIRMELYKSVWKSID